MVDGKRWDETTFWRGSCIKKILFCFTRHVYWCVYYAAVNFWISILSRRGACVRKKEKVNKLLQNKCFNCRFSQLLICHHIFWHFLNGLFFILSTYQKVVVYFVRRYGNIHTLFSASTCRVKFWSNISSDFCSASKNFCGFILHF